MNLLANDSNYNDNMINKINHTNMKFSQVSFLTQEQKQ